MKGDIQHYLRYVTLRHVTYVTYFTLQAFKIGDLPHDSIEAPTAKHRNRSKKEHTDNSILNYDVLYMHCRYKMQFATLLISLSLLLLWQTSGVKCDDSKTLTAGMSSILKAMSGSKLSESFKTISNVATKLGPVLGALGPTIGLVTSFLPKGPSPEMKLMKKEFAKIDKNFDKAFRQFDSVKNLLSKSTMKTQYSGYETHILHLSVMLQKATEASSMEKKEEFEYYKNKFLEEYNNHYNEAASALLRGMTVRGHTLENIPLVIRKASNDNRLEVQTFMKRIFNLIMQGVKAEFAYLVFQNKTTQYDILKDDWSKKLTTLLKHMASVDTSIKNSWFKSLDSDINKMLSDGKGKTHSVFADDLYAFLKKKYDWRDWFVVVYDGITGGDKHYVYICGGKIKFRKNDGKRNLILSSVLSTQKKPDKENLKKLLTGRSKQKNAEKMFKYKLPNGFKSVCSKGAIKKDAHPQFRGREDRFVLQSNKKYELFAFS
ncbi:hypothetical protein FSP39_001690 [Pinctada imbricata]|uniref:Uncharacterized protein n=1 Tax=Pinctada imbricata TaxID=66713 RepID=A0AA88YLG6_PINIB|nr:hypothetical protein FSP39_001690 [Pinctada imbricata]